MDPPMREDVAAIAGSGAVAELLTALCDVTGMGFVAVAMVAEDSWTACAVLDRISLGIAAGQKLDISNSLCQEVRTTRTAIVMDQASTDPRFFDHPVVQRDGFESYVSVPIILMNGDYFGNLCALNRCPVCISDPRIQLMFHCCAKLIARQVEAGSARTTSRPGALNKHIVGNLRGLFVSLLAEGAVAPGGTLTQLVPHPALQQLAARVATRGHRLESLVNDVLVYASGRLNGGMPGHIWKVDDLHARLKAVVADLVAAHPNRTIITNIAFDQPVDCDPARIQELVANLLSNALTHGAPSGPVSVIASTHDNDLEIAVWNEGNVISKHALRNVFSPALRPGADPPVACLGLHTCAEIVRAHLGTIGVTSSPTEGTQFVARIPLARSLRLH